VSYPSASRKSREGYSPKPDFEDTASSQIDNTKGNRELSLYFTRTPTNRIALGISFIGLISVLLNLKFFLDFLSPSDFLLDETWSFVSAAQIGFATLLLTTVATFGGVLYFVYSRFMSPLRSLETAVDELSKGNFDINLDGLKTEPFEGIANKLTEISVNFQEVLLFIGTSVGDAKANVINMEEILERMPETNQTSELSRQLSGIINNLEAVNSLMREFDFFHTEFDGEKVIADTKGTRASNLDQ